MVHRRLFRDDGLGVGENLDEMEYGSGEGLLPVQPHSTQLQPYGKKTMKTFFR
jgi:hypothetical protein